MIAHYFLTAPVERASSLLRQLAHNIRGIAAVEFAMIAPMMFFLLDRKSVV